MMKYIDWILFVLLSFIWGSSFLWIKIGVQDVSPLTLVAFRILFGFLGLIAVMAFSRQPVPRDLRTLLCYLFLGAFNLVLPWLLITWGETRITSGLASILNGTQPFFVIIFAHYWLDDEKINLPRIAGLVIGFIGVVILLSKDISANGVHGDLFGQLAVVLAAASYALANTFARRNLRNQPAILQSGMMFVFGTALIWPIHATVEFPVRLPSIPLTWISFLWLGLLGSCIAYIIYFRLLNHWGATRSSMVTYAIPLVGLVLGILFMGETLDSRIIFGTLLVLSGIAIVNTKFKTRNKAEECLIEA
jgi:drug/metabolite transporter (DMT)-like permease